MSTSSQLISPPDAIADATYRRVKWRIMPFLMLCYVVAFVDRSNVGFAKLQFTRDLGFSEAIYGLGGGMFFLGYLLLEIPSNLILARVGVRLTLLRIMILWGLCAAALAFMTNATEYYALRFFLGAAEAGFFPGILLYLTYWIPGWRRARFTAMFMASIALSGMIGGPVSGWIMQALDGWLGLKGWQWMFIVEGLPAIALGLVAYVYLDDNPAQSQWLSTEEKAIILRDLEIDRAQKRAHSHHSFGDALRSPSFYLLAAMAFAIFVSTAGIFLWLPTIIRRSGVQSVATIGLLSSIPFMVGFVAQYLVARHSDYTQERRWHASLSALVAAAGWGMMPLVQTNTALSLVMLTLATAGSLAAMGPFWTLPTTILSGTAAAGGIALITSVGSSGNFVSPILVGWLATKTGSLVIGQYYFAALLVLGATALLAGTGRAPAASRSVVAPRQATMRGA